MNEGPGFRGWDVSFRLPDGGQCDSFVPQRKGHPANFQKPKFTNCRKGNCECVELSDEVGYVRVKCMKERKSGEKKIRRFLDKSQGRYKKLIIDLRHNGGGSTYCSYDALIRPFLDEPLVYKQTSGVKRKLLADFAPELVGVLRFGCSKSAWETSVDEVPPPEGFDPNEWTFHEISREVKPSDRYAFDGDLYVLMDRQSGSATETYLDAIKRTGMTTLLGRRSYGALCGYMMAPVARLPESGMIFLMEADLDINPDGSINELTGVQPDVELPSCELPDRVDKETLLKDPWIQAVINGLSSPKQTSLPSTNRNKDS
jgi:C-terminal processing protease CtpA/Prc